MNRETVKNIIIVLLFVTVTLLCVNNRLVLNEQTKISKEMAEFIQHQKGSNEKLANYIVKQSEKDAALYKVLSYHEERLRRLEIRY